MLLLWAEYATAIIIESPTSHIRPLLIKTCDSIPLAKEKTRNIYMHYIDTLKNIQSSSYSSNANITNPVPVASVGSGISSSGYSNTSNSPDRTGVSNIINTTANNDNYKGNDIQMLKATSSALGNQSAESAIANFESLFATMNKYKNRTGDGNSIFEEASVELTRDVTSRGMTAALASITVSKLYKVHIIPIIRLYVHE